MPLPCLVMQDSATDDYFKTKDDLIVEGQSIMEGLSPLEIATALPFMSGSYLILSITPVRAAYMCTRHASLHILIANASSRHAIFVCISNR